MAKWITIWDYENNGKTVVIYNQHAQRYSRELWEKLKNKYGLTNDELAENLNNSKD